MDEGFRFSPLIILNHLCPISPKTCTHPGHSTILAKPSLWGMHNSPLQKPLEGIGQPRECPTRLSPTARGVLWAKTDKVPCLSLALCPPCLLADPQISNVTQELLFTSVSLSSALQIVKSSLLWQTKMKPGVFPVRLVKEQSPGCILYYAALGSVSWVLSSLASFLF